MHTLRFTFFNKIILLCIYCASECTKYFFHLHCFIYSSQQFHKSNTLAFFFSVLKEKNFGEVKQLLSAALLVS